MSKAPEPNGVPPVEPDPEATQARQQATAAVNEAEEHRRRNLEKLAEAAKEMERLVAHRRANRFAELFAAALERHQK